MLYDQTGCIILVDKNFVYSERKVRKPQLLNNLLNISFGRKIEKCLFSK